MFQQINPRVIEKLRQAKCHDTIKKFLEEMLFLELENIEQARYRYADRYDAAIEKCAKQYAEVKKNVL
jgi:hypothetical protein